MRLLIDDEKVWGDEKAREEVMSDASQNVILHHFPLKGRTILFSQNVYSVSFWSILEDILIKQLLKPSINSQGLYGIVLEGTSMAEFWEGLLAEWTQALCL